MKFNFNELAKIEINPNCNIREQLQELGLDGKRVIDDENLYNEIYDNLTNELYLDEVGQVWKRNFNNNFNYIAKIKI